MEISPTLDAVVRSKLGQFMTPASVARFMASLFGDLPEEIHLLDPGAGVGSLTAAFVQEACSRRSKPRSINVTAYELDPVLAAHLEATLGECALDCQRAGITFSARIARDNYIIQSAEPLLRAAERVEFNCAVMNPPYAKINLGSAERRALTSLGIETSNLYAAFVALAVQQLVAEGQLVAITPRSFCNGTYFEPFRRLILRSSALQRFHLYESRRHAFQDDDVLQENVVFKLTRGLAQPETVQISSSLGTDTDNVMSRSVPFEEVVHPQDRHAYIRLVTSDEDSNLAQRVQALPETLKTLGLKVSTGRVVDFRARAALRQDPEPGAVPLIYPAHFKDGFVVWPRLGGKKANALAHNEATADLTVPAGFYVLTKRFTSKEERRRIVAAIYDPGRFSAEQVGFENHLNYFHKDGAGLSRLVAKGLTLFLNSTAVDQYFRLFSGHTQVNATDLRNLHYPTLNQLEDLGLSLGEELPEQPRIDELVAPVLGG